MSSRDKYDSHGRAFEAQKRYSAFDCEQLDKIDDIDFDCFMNNNDFDVAEYYDEYFEQQIIPSELDISSVHSDEEMEDLKNYKMPQYQQPTQSERLKKVQPKRKGLRSQTKIKEMNLKTKQRFDPFKISDNITAFKKKPKLITDPKSFVDKDVWSGKPLLTDQQKANRKSQYPRNKNKLKHYRNALDWSNFQDDRSKLHSHLSQRRHQSAEPQTPS